MNKKTFIEELAKRQGGTLAQAERDFDDFFQIIFKEVKRGNDVTFTGIGKFSLVKRKARIARNPKTGEEVKVPATVVPKFKPGKSFKDFVKS